MRRRAGLLTRLERVERRKRAKRFPRIVLHVGEREEAEIIGYQAGNVTLLRNGPIEPLGELQARAWGLGSTAALFALYVRPTAPESKVAEPIAAPPAAEPWVEPVPGVGRRASRDELIKAGGIPVPPERLI